MPSWTLNESGSLLARHPVRSLPLNNGCHSWAGSKDDVARTDVARMMARMAVAERMGSLPVEGRASLFYFLSVPDSGDVDRKRLPGFALRTFPSFPKRFPKGNLGSDGNGWQFANGVL